MKSVVTAFNNRDTAYFDKLIAPDAVWLDEDGHHLLATVWMNRLLSANPARKLSITNLRTESWDTGGWVGFNYVLEATNQVKGINSMVFKKAGNDWKIVMIHGAVDTAIVQH
jgi:ketosteroid isomerase-like protein